MDGKTNKILVCGDLHAKYHIFERVKELAKNYAKVIFLGDYVDDWNSVPEANYNIVKSLIEWKKSEPEKVVLLLGNHDISEWLGFEFRCSGFSYGTHALVWPLFDENVDCFELAHAEGQILFTHAGLTNRWAHYAGLGWHPPTAKYYAEALNDKFLYCKTDAEMIILATVGAGRGGSDIPSPIWADKTELEHDRIAGRMIQVVGHTPVDTIKINDELGMVFCDTHSTYSSGRPIGDNSLLEIEINNKNGGMKCANWQRLGLSGL